MPLAAAEKLARDKPLTRVTAETVKTGEAREAATVGFAVRTNGWVGTAVGDADTDCTEGATEGAAEGTNVVTRGDKVGADALGTHDSPAPKPLGLKPASHVHDDDPAAELELRGHNGQPEHTACANSALLPADWLLTQASLYVDRVVGTLREDRPRHADTTTLDELAALHWPVEKAPHDPEGVPNEAKGTDDITEPTPQLRRHD